MFLRVKNCVSIYFGLFLVRFQIAVKAEVGNLTFRPYDPITTSDSITLQCIASHKIMVSGDIEFQFDDSEWIQHDTTDKDGNPFISKQISKNGNMTMTQVECRVKVLDNQYDTTTTVYFLQDNNDPVVVEESKDVQMSCVADTTGVHEHLKYFWFVNGTPNPDKIYERIMIKDQHALVLGKADVNDSALNITCAVVSKRSFEQFYNENITRAIMDGSAHTFRKHLSVLHFEKRLEQNNNTVYEVKINGMDAYDLQWRVNNEKGDSTISNSTSITVSSAILPTLVVLYDGKILWNDTVHIDVHADNTKTSDHDPSPPNEDDENDDDKLMLPIIVSIVGAVVIFAIVFVVCCCRRCKQSNKGLTHVECTDPEAAKGDLSGDPLLKNAEEKTKDTNIDEEFDEKFVDAVSDQK